MRPALHGAVRLAVGLYRVSTAEQVHLSSVLSSTRRIMRLATPSSLSGLWLSLIAIAVSFGERMRYARPRNYRPEFTSSGRVIRRNMP